MPDKPQVSAYLNRCLTTQILHQGKSGFFKDYFSTVRCGTVYTEGLMLFYRIPVLGKGHEALQNDWLRSSDPTNNTEAGKVH